MAEGTSEVNDKLSSCQVGEAGNENVAEREKKRETGGKIARFNWSRDFRFPQRFAKALSTAASNGMDRVVSVP